MKTRGLDARLLDERSLREYERAGVPLWYGDERDGSSEEVAMAGRPKGSKNKVKYAQARVQEIASDNVVLTAALSMIASGEEDPGLRAFNVDFNTQAYQWAKRIAEAALKRTGAL